MAKIQSRLLVVDASIASAAGDFSKHPTSQRCREFLLAIREICHRIVLTPPIQKEWDKHQSGFARKWRLSMVAKRKLAIIEIPKNQSMEMRFRKVVKDPSILAIMEKDRCLIEAALLSEKRVASLDEEVRTHFRSYQTSLPELMLICWVNPSDRGEDLCDWLPREPLASGSGCLGLPFINQWMEHRGP